MNWISFQLFNLYDRILNFLDKISGKKYAFIFGVALSASFVFGKPVLATELVDQQFLGSGFYNNTPVSWEMRPFTPTQSNITAVEFTSANLWTNKRYEVFVCIGEILSGTNYGGQGCGSFPQVAWGTSTSGTSETLHKLTFKTPGSLLPGAKHFFAVHVIQTSGQFTVSGASGGNATNTATSTWISTTETITTLQNNWGVVPYFKTYYDNTLPPNIQNLEVKLLQPAGNVGLSSPVFRGLFRDDYKYADTLVISIQNANGSSSVSFIPLANSTSTIKIKSFGPFPDDDVAFFNSYSQRGTSTWTAYLEKNGNIVSTIPQVYTFYIGETEQLLDGEISTAQACPRDDLNTFTGQFSCALKKAFYWSIYPTQSSIDNFKTAGQNLKNSFPFTVYFQLTDTISNTISSTTLNQNNTIGIPMINKQKEIYIAPFLSSSTMPNAIGQSNTNLIRNTISFLIWIGVAVAVFFTIRKL